MASVSESSSLKERIFQVNLLLLQHLNQINMKKKKQLGAFIVLVLILSSCIGDIGNTIVYSRIGVVRGEPEKHLLTSDGYSVVWPELGQDALLETGTSLRVNFKTNFFEKGEGRYEAELIDYEILPHSTLQVAQTDTTTILTKDERRISAVAKINNLFIDGYYFFKTDVAYPRLGEKVDFQLFYDPHQADSMTIDGRHRIYELFLRVSKSEGTDTLKAQETYTCSYHIQELIEDVKQTILDEGKDSLIFRVNYGSRFNADTTAFVWTASDTMAVRLAR
ncbi:hypothetical protein [Parabacteroides sp. PF5-9]|uniref:hypothetical protein n=1 Tax=Parabacteroides sp. PF5-9 TaxID=1742404 RepID=UPI002476DC3D|nr:hypothetical protein [Parabacteroides sp. PF5-9]MDH6357179.1 hypothetical protein [Parabacteroides sp. PF5-9]